MELMKAITLPPVSPWTYEDLPDTPDDGRRWEIIGGSLIVSPSPVTRHQVVVFNLAVYLQASKTAETVVLVSPIDWRYNETDVVIPDLMVAGREDLDLDGPLRAPAVPRLVVEVLSPSNRIYDLTLKRELYQSLSVPAYWVVDPAAMTLTALRLAGGVFETEFEGGGQFATDWPFAVTVDVAGLADL